MKRNRFVDGNLPDRSAAYNKAEQERQIEEQKEFKQLINEYALVRQRMEPTSIMSRLRELDQENFEELRPVYIKIIQETSEGLRADLVENPDHLHMMALERIQNERAREKMKDLMPEIDEPFRYQKKPIQLSSDTVSPFDQRIVDMRRWAEEQRGQNET